jgi:hypothetical protein
LGKCVERKKKCGKKEFFHEVFWEDATERYATDWLMLRKNQRMHRKKGVLRGSILPIRENMLLCLYANDD